MPTFSSVCTPTSPFVRYVNLFLQLFAIIVYALNPPKNVPLLARLRFCSLFLILVLSAVIFLLQNNHNMEFPNALAIALVGIIQSFRTRNDTQENATQENPVREMSMREILLSLTSSEMNGFFAKLKLTLRDLRKGEQGIERVPLGTMGMALKSKLEVTQLNVCNALTDRFDTQDALRELQELMRAAKLYMNSEERISMDLLECVGRYIAGVFGLTPTVDIGCGAKEPSREEIIAPVLDAFVALRDEIRAIARNGGENSSRQLLEICEHLRADSLPPLVFRLEGVDSERRSSTRWKLENAESIMKDVETRKEETTKRKGWNTFGKTDKERK